MATRRSRIKAVANLPARRNRPVASSDVKKEDLDCAETNDVPTPTEDLASNITENVKGHTQQAQTELTEDSHSTSTSSEDTQTASVVNFEDAPTDNNNQTTTSENLTTPASEAVDTNPTNPSKRPPLRTRRSKPTVNITAATRKRPANDTVVSSPCSPPPNKIKCLDRRNSESEDNHEESVTKTAVTSNQSAVLESKYQSTGGNNFSSPLSPPPVTISNKSLANMGNTDNTSGLFKVPAPVTPTSKSKEVTVSDSSPFSTKGDGSMSVQKEPSNSKKKQSTNAQRVAAARKNLKSRINSDGTAPRSALTMFDLIFYNPSKNPMKSTGSSCDKNRPRLNSVSSVSSIHEDRLNEESVDDLEDAPTTEKTDTEEEETVMPVPQVKVGPDGSLILDEQSLVIETTDAKKNREELEKSEVIVDTGTSNGHYKKIVRSKDWSDHETKKFYRALNVVGTDFSLMKPYFRNRTRRELKIKFKKEERLNPNLINKALAEPLDFDISELEKECELEDEEEKRLEEQAKEKAAEKLKEKTENAQVNANKPVQKMKKKRKVKGSISLAEIGLEAENTSSKKKIRPQVIVQRGNKISDAEADYNILAMGVDLKGDTPPKKAKNKKTSEVLKTQGENSNKKEKSVKSVKRKHPGLLSLSIGETHEQGNCDVQVVQSSYETSPAMTKTIVSTSDVEGVPANSDCGVPIVQLSLPAMVPANDPKLVPAKLHSSIEIVEASSQTISPTTAQKLIPSKPQSCIQTGQTFPQTDVSAASSKEVVPTHQTRIQIVEASSLTLPSTPQSHIQIVQAVPPTVVPVSSPKVISSTSQSHIETKTTTPKTINILRKQPLVSRASSSESKTPDSLSASCSTPPSSSNAVPIFTTPLNSNSLVSTAGAKLVQSPLLGVTTPTPVSRLLPSTPPLPRMEPGSIIVLKTPLPQDPDRHVLQVYMVTNTPPGSSQTVASAMPHTPIVPGINLLSGPLVQPANVKSPCISDDSDCEKVLTKL